MRFRSFVVTVVVIILLVLLGQAAQADASEPVACGVQPVTIVEGPVMQPFTATYTSQLAVINVLTEYRWDAGVLYHEMGHHFFYECLANEHPYWGQPGMEERFADAWAEYRLGYDVSYYDVPWIDAYWMRLWSEARTFYWVSP